MNVKGSFYCCASQQSAVSSPWFVSNELRHSFTALLRSLPSATGVLDQRYSEDPVTVGCIIQQHLFSTNMEVFCEKKIIFSTNTEVHWIPWFL